MVKSKNQFNELENQISLENQNDNIIVMKLK